jgi:hypothetical protein
MKPRADRSWTLLRLGSARSLTRACWCGVFLEPLNPTLYYMD